MCCRTVTNYVLLPIVSFLHLVDFVLQAGDWHFTNISTGMLVPVRCSASGHVAAVLIRNLQNNWWKFLQIETFRVFFTLVAMEAGALLWCRFSNRSCCFSLSLSGEWATSRSLLRSTLFSSASFSISTLLSSWKDCTERGNIIFAFPSNNNNNNLYFSTIGYFVEVFLSAHFA